MGYTTDFELETDGNTDAVLSAFVNQVGYDPFDESTKWYEHQSDAAIVSRQFPLTLITLNCKGEDGKQWRVYAVNGETQAEYATITFPPCQLTRPVAKYITVSISVAGVDVPIKVEYLGDLTESELYTLGKEELKRLL